MAPVMVNQRTGTGFPFVNGVFQIVSWKRRHHHQSLMPFFSNLSMALTRRVKVFKDTFHGAVLGCAFVKGRAHAASSSDFNGGRTNSLISAMATEGMTRMKRRNHTKNHPNEPAIIPHSTQFGVYNVQAAGSYWCANAEAIML